MLDFGPPDLRPAGRAGAARSVGASIRTRANWMVPVYQPRTAKHDVNFGYYDLRLASHEGVWRIAWQKIHLKNDVVPALIDVDTL